jgi:hypothetical protein
MNRHAIVSSDHEKDHVKLPHPHITEDATGGVLVGEAITLMSKGEEMRWNHLRQSLCVSVVLLGLALATPAMAQWGAAPIDEAYELKWAHLKLLYTTIQTAALREISYQQFECQPVTKPLVFDCPAPRGQTCTLGLEVSMPYWNLSPGWAVMASAKIDGWPFSTLPAPSVTVATAALNEDIDPWNTSAWQWVRPDLARGWHRLELCVEMGFHPWATEPGRVGIGPSVVKISVYK